MTDASTEPTSAASDPAIVILGGSGDLTQRLLFPAIFRLLTTGALPASTRIVGYAIDDWTTEQFVTHLRTGIDQFGGGTDDATWAPIAARVGYHSGDLTPEKLAVLTADIAGPTLFYLALPPAFFGAAATGLGAVGLADEAHGWRRVVVEKPFGTSLTTARALQDELRRHWAEEQINRIDHFLGKETVQNMLVLRLANRFVEAIWNARNIAEVQITAAETLGLEGRWRYYDQAGALRDMLQNHLMQLFCLTALEPLSSWDAEVLREHKVEVLRSVRPIDADDVVRSSVRGQYTAGTHGTDAVPGYLQEEHIPPTSTTETYAALRLMVDNWRWQGVPFHLRSGKRVDADVTEIALRLQEPPTRLFPDGLGSDDLAGWIILQLRPAEGVIIGATAKEPGIGLKTRTFVLSASEPTEGGEYSAYEQLVLDAFQGDRSHFIRWDEAELAWGIVQPVLDAWASGGAPATYAAGSAGPDAPDGFFAAGSGWRDLSITSAPPAS
jgi:glucose-6-phosphate 1-dehydrogenase